MSGLDKLGSSVENKLSSRQKMADNSLPYYEFFKEAFSVLEPGTILKENWHIEFLCNLLEKEIHRIGAGEPKENDYVVNLMFRSLKSYIFTICLQPWAWTIYPEMRFSTASYGDKLSLDHSSKSKELVESDWYQSAFGDVFKIRSDSKSKSFIRNNRGGERKATSIGGAAKGFGANVWVIDDAIKPPEKKEIGVSQADIEKAHDWHDNTFYDRLNDPKVDLRVIVEQRLNPRDLSGYVLSKDYNYKHICIPSILDDNAVVKPKKLSMYYEDGLFFKERFDWDQMEQYKKVLGKNFWGQCQQMPRADEGTYWEKSMFNKIDDDKIDRMEKNNYIRFYWDLATSKKNINSATAWIKVFVNQNRLFISDYGYFWEKTPYTKEEIKNMQFEGTCFVEYKSAGESLVPIMQEEGYDVEAIKHNNQDKIQNTSEAIVRPVVKNKNIYVRASIYDVFLEEDESQAILDFPNAAKDDVNDTLCMAIHDTAELIDGDSSSSENLYDNVGPANPNGMNNGLGSLGVDFSNSAI